MTTTSPPEFDLPTMQPSLGRRLKALRSSRGLSLKGVAAATNISASFISMVETGQTEITVGRLMTLADFYEVSMADLISTADRPVVLRREDRSTSETPDHDVKTEMLARSGQGDMSGGFMTFEVDADLSEVPKAGRAFVLVLCGRLGIEFSGDRTVLLREGDAVWFEAGRKHRFTNAGQTPTRIFTLRRSG
jgi:transcriptional regulator with XRE-family HTH domain